MNYINVAAACSSCFSIVKTRASHPLSDIYTKPHTHTNRPPPPQTADAIFSIGTLDFDVCPALALAEYTSLKM